MSFKLRSFNCQNELILIFVCGIFVVKESFCGSQNVVMANGYLFWLQAMLCLLVI